MTVKVEPLATLTSRAIKVLTRELGTADAIRFVNQFTVGYGDYTADRVVLTETLSLDQIIADIKGKSPSEPGKI